MYHNVVLYIILDVCVYVLNRTGVLNFFLRIPYKMLKNSGKPHKPKMQIFIKNS